MGSAQAGIRHDEASLPHEQAGPTVARVLLGARLRKLREDAQVTRDDAGRAIRGSESKISRLELGRTGFKRRDVSDLLARYGVSDEAERATLLALAEQANTAGWWRDYEDVLPGWFEPYLGLEQAASLIWTYETLFVPGLLQTPDYARAVLQSGAGDDAPGAETGRRTALRMQRQQILHRPDPPHVWAVIDEAALRRPVGGRVVMRAQIRHLMESAQFPHIRLQVLPFSAGGCAGTGVPVTLLRFPEAELADVVYLEQLISATYPARPADLACYRTALTRLAAQAHTPAASVTTLQHVLDET
jgi:transcriptional regulator with XRE-family HTH domain